MAMSNQALLEEVARFAAALARFQRGLELVTQAETTPALMTAEQWQAHQAQQEREAGTHLEDSVVLTETPVTGNRVQVQSEPTKADKDFSKSITKA